MTVLERSTQLQKNGLEGTAELQQAEGDFDDSGDVYWRAALLAGAEPPLPDGLDSFLIQAHAQRSHDANISN